jgi:hypothetical protein
MELPRYEAAARSPAFAIRHPAIVRHEVLIIEELLLVLESQTFYEKQPQGGFFASFFLN